MKISRLQRLRNFDAAYAELQQRLMASETCWLAAEQAMSDRRSFSIEVAASVAMFAKDLGLSRYATERLNDLFVGLGELESGRTSALLQRADLPTRTLAPSDLAQRAVAQVCVDFYRLSGLTADDARKRTARLFLRYGFKNFSYSKIKSLGSSLKGPGASLDPAFREYEMGSALATQLVRDSGAPWPPTENVAEAAARRLIAAISARDHRLAA